MHGPTRNRIATALDSTRPRRTRPTIVIALIAAATAALAAGPATFRFAADDVLPNDNRIGAGQLRMTYYPTTIESAPASFATASSR